MRFVTRATVLITILFCLIYPTLSILDQTYFKILGISSSETSKQAIEKAYLQSKKKLEQTKAEPKSIELLEQAYKVINDNTLRQKYERYNSLAWKDLPSSIKIQQQEQRKGPVINLDVPITFEQMFNGGNISLKYSRKSACPRCEGYGFKNPHQLKTCNHCKGKGYEIITVETRNGFKQKREQPCNRCKGSGKQAGTQCPYCSGKKLISELAEISVPIERGLTEGHTLVLKNFGDERQLGAPSDLKLTFKEKNDGKWTRTKLNIEYIMDISLEEAIFGINRQITHLDGRKFLITLPGPILTSTTHTIPGQGLISRKDKSRKGDLIIKPSIKFQKFNDEQLDLWEKIFSS